MPSTTSSQRSAAARAFTVEVDRFGAGNPGGHTSAFANCGHGMPHWLGPPCAMSRHRQSGTGWLATVGSKLHSEEMSRVQLLNFGISRAATKCLLLALELS